RVFGAAVFPAAGFIDLALTAGRRVLATPAIVLEDVEILRALVLPETGNVIVQTIVRRDGDRCAFTIQRANGNDEATVLAAGRLRAGKTAPIGRLDLNEEFNACASEMDVAKAYDAFAVRGVAFGPDFRALSQLRRGSGKSLGRVRLPEHLRSDAHGEGWHPVLLDA